MNIAPRSCAVVTGAITAAFATYAMVASARVSCRAAWPANITQCANSENPPDSVVGSGTDFGTQRNVFVMLTGTRTRGNSVKFTGENRAQSR
jgi:hypothetical protein